MRTRRLATAALLAGGLAFGAMTGSASAASASAASASAASVSATEGWHLAGYYQYNNQCVRAGFTAITSGGIVQDFKCEHAGSRYALYLYY